MKIKPIDITVVSSTSVTITIPLITLVNGCTNELLFCLTRPGIEKLRTSTGTEPVLIQNGVGGTSYILEDQAGNVFYSDKLLLNRKYCIRFGNNGAVSTTGAGGLAHFINLNTPCCSRGYDPANAPAAEGE